MLTTVVFDAYGTLLDVDAAARAAAAEPDAGRLAELWPALARDWRLKQLEYTWLRAVAGHHADFWQVTGDSLDWTLEAHGLTDEVLRARLMGLYRTLETYPEVPAALARVRERGLATAILSNGTPGMLADAVAAAGIADRLDRILSVEAAGIYKPAARVYALVEAAFGCAREEVLFVSSNGWDAAGAAGYGFRTLWVNRRGAPVDRLHARPDHVGADLTALEALL